MKTNLFFLLFLFFLPPSLIAQRAFVPVKVIPTKAQTKLLGKKYSLYQEHNYQFDFNYDGFDDYISLLESTGDKCLIKLLLFKGEKNNKLSLWEKSDEIFICNLSSNEREIYASLSIDFLRMSHYSFVPVVVLQSQTSTIRVPIHWGEKDGVFIPELQHISFGEPAFISNYQFTDGLVKTIYFQEAGLTKIRCYTNLAANKLKINQLGTLLIDAENYYTKNNLHNTAHFVWETDFWRQEREDHTSVDVEMPESEEKNDFEENYLNIFYHLERQSDSVATRVYFKDEQNKQHLIQSLDFALFYSGKDFSSSPNPLAIRRDNDVVNNIVYSAVAHTIIAAGVPMWQIECIWYANHSELTQEEKNPKIIAIIPKQ